MKPAWTLTTLSDLLIPVSRSESVDSTKEYRLLGIRLEGAGPFHRETKLGSQISASTLSQVKDGDFIYSRLFASRGAFGVINVELDGCYVSGEFPTFRPITNKLDIDFLRLWFRLPSVISKVEANCTGSTPLTRNRFKEYFLLAMEFPLPSLSEQRRIVARIEELSSKIEEARELRQKSIDKTEALKHSMLGQAFKSNSSYKIVRLEDVCEAVIDNLHSNPIYSDEGVPCIRSSDVGWGKLYLNTARKTTEEEYYRRTVRGEPTVDDIVLVREGGGTGKAAIVEEGQRFSLGQRVMMLRPDKNVVVPNYFLYQLLSPAIYDEQIIPRSKGSASPHLNIGALKKFTFFLPPLKEQHYIVAHLDTTLNKLDILQQIQSETATELDALMPAILDRAFRGEL